LSEVVVRAASYLGPDGHGNDQTGLRPWPAHLREAFAQGDLSALHWTLLFQSDPSRFARMDLMCRLGLMATELLEAKLAEMDAGRREQAGVCVETCAGSLTTDVRFLQTPRPSLFTYTLPSTLVGEICIRYRLRGPVLCLVAPEPPGRAGLLEGMDWVRQGEVEDCLCVVCEAADCELPKVVSESIGAKPSAWRAAALLLGRSQGRGGESPPGPGSLAEICRALCAAGVEPACLAQPGS
jgi:3-oxoacyl-(acyl-carrier-protein) synthase